MRQSGSRTVGQGATAVHGGRLIGREDQIAVAEAALGRAAAGHSQFLTLTGGLGVGKTRIAAEICAIAEGRGQLVLSGRGTRVEGDSALGPQTLSDQLERPPGERPVVLLLDDLQWLDEASRDLVTHVLRTPPERPVLFVLGCRSGQWPATVERLLRSPTAGWSVTAICVPPLTAGAMGELVGEALDPATRRRIWRDSGGNPFYALSLAGAVHADEALAARVPSPVLTAIAGDMSSLSPAARSMLRAAAMIGHSAAVDLAAAVAEVDSSDASRAVAELVGRELLATSATTRLEFRAPIVRRAVYQGMGLAACLTAHERAARLLAERGAPPAERARHVEHGGRREPDDVALLLEAAESSSLSRPPVAARWFVAALQRLSDDDERQPTALIRASAALLRAGRGREGREAFERFGATAPAGSLERPDMSIEVARVEQMLGLAGPSRTALRHSLAQEMDERFTTEGRVVLAMDYWRTGERQEMAQQARLALESAHPAGDDCLRANAVAMLALAEYTLGNTASATARLDEAEQLVGTTRDEVLIGGLEAILLVGYLSYGLERYAKAAEHYQRGILLAGIAGNAYLRVPLTVGRSATELATGKLEQARATAADALELASTLGSRQLLMLAHGLCALIALGQGRVGAALESARGATEAADGVTSGFLTTAVRCCVGATHLEAGDAQLCQEQILRHAGGPELDRLDVGIRPDAYATLAKAARLLGDLDRAEEWVQRAEATAGELRLRGPTATARAARARLLLERDPQVAARPAAEAADAFEAIGRIADAGRALTISGRACASSGAERQAVARLERAHAMLGDCGAQRARDLVARELRRLGQTISRPPGRGDASGGVDALSRREREVAELVARGLTNKRIADEMFVSAKTVEDHLARAFAKLGVSSRAGVAAAVESARTLG